MTAKQRRALELIKQIKAKLLSLKHGYITETELNELEELVKKIR